MKAYCDECRFHGKNRYEWEVCLHENAQHPPSRKINPENAYSCSIQNLDGKCRDFVAADSIANQAPVRPNIFALATLHFSKVAEADKPKAKRYRGSRYATGGIR